MQRKKTQFPGKKGVFLYLLAAAHFMSIQVLSWDDAGSEMRFFQVEAIAGWFHQLLNGFLSYKTLVFKAFKWYKSWPGL